MKIKKLTSLNNEHNVQQYEESTLQALDAVCASDTQTYDQFMANFTHLTPADVVGTPVNIGGGSEDDDWQPPDLPPLVHSSLPMATMNQSIGALTTLDNTNDDNDSQVKNVTTLKHASDALDEEVLAEGTIMEPYMMRSSTNTETLKVRLGNFVEDEVGSEEEEASGYLPSFLQTEATENKAPMTTATVSKSPVPLVAPESKLISKAQTSKVSTLLDELAAIQDGKLQGKVVKPPEPVLFKEQCIISSAPQGKVSTLLDELAAIQNGKSTGNVAKERTKLSDSAEGSSVLNIDFPKKDSCEIAAQIMAHAAVKSHCDKDQSESTEENILDLIGRDGSGSEDENVHDEYDYDNSLDIPNPGEIVEEKDTIVKDFVTKLSFTAHVRDGRTKSPPAPGYSQDAVKHSAENNQAVTEEVEAFSLDENFDYDNVVLSPKYNEAEMATILNAMKATSQEQANAS